MLLSLFASVQAAQAATTVYVRPDGHDTLCNGTADVDYHEAVAPTCAVQTIQTGIALVDAGGTVNVAAGTYTENVGVNKSVWLVGAAGAIIDGGNTGTVVDITASNVTLEGFTVQHSGTASADAGVKMTSVSGVTVKSNTVVNNANGVVVVLASNNFISGNQINTNTYYGVALVAATGNTIDLNSMSVNGLDAIALENASAVGGAVTTGSTGNFIKSNVISSNRDGIFLGENCDGNQVTDANQITSAASIGISLWRSDGHTITGNTINNTSAGIRLLGSSNNLINGNFINTNTSGIDVDASWQVGVWYQSANNSIEDNDISGNTAYGIEFGTEQTEVIDASPNYWGSACGPTNLSGNVIYSPWYIDATMTATAAGEAGVLTFPAGSNTGTMNTVIACAAPGSTLTFDSGTYPGGLLVGADKSNLTFGLLGTTVTGGSPAFTIYGDDITVQNGILDGWSGSANNDTAAIQINTGADNFNLLRCEVMRWKDGLELLGPVTSFKVVSNWFHDNTESGLQVNSGALVNGVLTIEGNLFKENTGSGIQNDSGALLEAEYNSWGDYAGPTAGAGDGVSANVDYEPWTFFEPYIDVDPDNELLLRDVVENQAFDVKLKVDTQKLYGLSFKLTWDATMLTLNSTTFSSSWAGKCASLGSAAGELSYRCNLEYPTPEYDADGGTILTMNFTAGGSGLSGNGAWESFFDISHLAIDTSAGAVGGVKIWVNNAGYGLPSLAEHDITDSDDGKLIITGLANYTGFVDLQGRTDDSGALVQVFDLADKATSVELANATSAAGGGYTTAHLSPEIITVGSTYYLFVDRALYLPTTIMFTDPSLIPQPPIPTVWEDFKLLSQRPLTPLSLVFLLGGDAVSDNLIDILDAGCIGSAYNPAAPNASTCGGQGSSDVNGDTYTDIFDLTLMGGNFTLNVSPWAP